jgi:DNA-binding transcriptional LysR family regulator
MHIHQLDLNLFTVFEAIHSEGSVTRAGQKLNLTQPAISHSLGRLRNLLKDDLFIRQGKKMVPTPLCRSIIGEVRNALHLLEVSIQERGFDPARSNRLFQIGWRNLFEPAMLPPLMRRIEQRAPGITLACVRIDRRDIELDLASGTVDLAIDIGMPVGDAVHQKQLVAEDYVVVSRAQHPAIRGSLNLKTYLSQAHILVSSRRMGPAIIDVELKGRGAKRTIGLRCQDYFTACRVVSQTNLLLTMPERFARVANVQLDNRVHPFPMKIPRFGVYLYWHSTADADPENRWLREQIIDLFAG